MRSLASDYTLGPGAVKTHVSYANKRIACPARATVTRVLCRLYIHMMTPLILGHRGAPAEQPENTLASFRRALELGADGVELDVQCSADGVPVVIHDPTLERTTRGAGRVGAHTWDALSRIKAGTGEPLPSLEKVARWAAGTGAWLNVELKAAGVEAASLGVLREQGMLERCFLSSFLPDTVRSTRRLAPDVSCYLLSDLWNPQVLATARETRASGVCLRHDAASPAALQELADAGLPLVVWTVDDPARIRALLRAGVAALITNHPERGVAERRALNL